MLRLRTLGSVDLRDAADRELTAVLAQPKRMALLCYLALAPAGRRRRDSVLATFWPESEAGRARKALGQSLYVLRQALGAGVITSIGDAEIGIDPTALSCDAAELVARIGSGDTARALELYGGDLLVGFHVADTPPFERWLDEERARLRALAGGAARALAAAETAAGNAVGALPWLRHALRIEPFDEALLRELMLQLERLGDRSGALREYTAFERRFEAELELRPGAETDALMRRIRAHRDPGVDPVAPATPSPDGTAPAPAPRIQPADAPDATDATPDGTPDATAASPSRWPSTPARLRGRLTTAGVIVLTLLAGATVWLAETAPPADDAAESRVVVLPLGFDGGGRADVASRVTELLRQKLSIAGVIAVETRAAADGRQRSAGGIPMAIRPAPARRPRGPELHVSGSVVEAGGRYELLARLHEPGGRTRIEATATAAGDAELFDAVEDLARKLLGAVRPGPAGHLGRAAAASTRSLPAVRAFLAGEHWLRAGRYSDALESFEEAVAADTALALGWYRLSMASVWADQQRTDPTVADRRAVRLSASLAKRDSLLVTAYTSWRVGRADTAEYLARALVDAHPDDLEAWHQLGETLFHYNPVRGRPVAEAADAFLRTLELDPAHLSSLWHLAQLHVGAPDGSAEPYFRRLLRGERPGGKSLEIRALDALRRGDAVAEAALGDEIRDADLSTVATLVRLAAVQLGDLDAAERMAGWLTGADGLTGPRVYGHAQLAYLAVARGRMERAGEHLDAMDRLDPEHGFYAAIEARAMIALLPTMPPDPAALRALRDTLRGRLPEHDGEPRAFETYPARRHYLLGRLETALGDQEAALAHARALDAMDGPATAGWAAGVRARVALRQGRPEAALRLLERAPIQAWLGFAVSSPPHSGADERWLRAELLAAAGRTDEAVRWYASFGEHSVYDLVYLDAARARLASIDDPGDGREPRRGR